MRMLKSRVDGVTCPSVIGAGLLALDIVISEVSEAPPEQWAGGTCGNVLIALGYLGWKSQPVARLKTGAAVDRDPPRPQGMGNLRPVHQRDRSG